MMYQTFFEELIQKNPSTSLEVVAAFILPSAILAAGVFDDLRSQKVHNKLILSLLPFAVIGQFLGFGLEGLGYGALAFLLSLAITVPMVLTGMLGGGDMKLYAVFALATNLNATIWVGITSLVWGGLLGVVRAILNRQSTLLLMNTIGLLKKERPDDAHLTKVPYTVALAFGWMTYLSLTRLGGLL